MLATGGISEEAVNSFGNNLLDILNNNNAKYIFTADGMAQ